MPVVLAKELARVLEQEIIFGEIAPEARLVEEEVGERFGISRSPVREALRLVEQDGLVIRHPRRGIWASPVGRADLDEVYSCRLALEGLAAEQAARARAPSHVAALEKALAEMEAAHARGDVRAYFQGNVDFTDVIHDAAKNETLRRLLNGIGKQALRYRYLAYASAPELVTMSLSGSKDILAAVSQGNARLAREVTERLIRRSWDAIGAAIERGAAA